MVLNRREGRLIDYKYGYSFRLGFKELQHIIAYLFDYPLSLGNSKGIHRNKRLYNGSEDKVESMNN